MERFKKLTQKDKMKTLFITLLLIFGMKSYGQNSNLKISSNGSIKFYDVLIFTQGGFNAQINKGSDTLEITSTGNIHFIKIGDRVYKIESPTLTEIKENVGNGLFLPHYQNWKGSMIPTLNGLIDTAKEIKITRQP